MSIPRDQALLALKDHVADDDIVVAVYQTNFDWMVLNPRPLNYVAVGAMGQASSHGLGLALANPERRVFVFDGDGSLLMNLGSLVTIAGAAPPNLHHFVFANGTYEVNGEQPLPGAVDFAGMAQAAGYRHASRFGDLAAFQSALLRPSGNTTVRRWWHWTSCRVRSYPRDYDYIHSAEARATFEAALREKFSSWRGNLNRFLFKKSR